MPPAPNPGGRSEGRLAVVGAINWDVSIFEQRFARPGEEVPVRLVEEYSGGKGANVAVAAARILGPGRVSLVGALGDDEVSGTQIVLLRNEGVETRGIVVLKGRRSGRAYIIVDGQGRKTIHTHFGANAELDPSHLGAAGVRAALSGNDLVVVMDTPVKVAKEVARIANREGARVLYSPGVRAAEGLRSISAVAAKAEFMILDSNELRNLCRTSDVAVALRLLRKKFPDLTVVATLGQAGCVVDKGGVTTRVEGVSLGRLGLRAVNSTGSGDAFLGVFSSYVLRGAPTTEAVAWANLAGALKATRFETRGSPTRKELESGMARLGITGRQPGWQARKAS
jgi:ribokinase